eukprot:s2291_g6.t1
MAHSVGILMSVDHSDPISRVDFSDFPGALLVPRFDGPTGIGDASGGCSWRRSFDVMVLFLTAEGCFCILVLEVPQAVSQCAGIPNRTVKCFIIASKFAHKTTVSRVSPSRFRCDWVPASWLRSCSVVAACCCID